MTLVKQFFVCLGARVYVLDKEKGGVCQKEYKATTDVCSLDICSAVGHCQGSS